MAERVVLSHNGPSGDIVPSGNRTHLRVMTGFCPPATSHLEEKKSLEVRV